jgi:uncharacterized protein (DUF433 family)
MWVRKVSVVGGMGLGLQACLAVDCLAGSGPAGNYNEDVMAESAVVRDPEILSGTPCFRGTRVPFKNLIDYLEGGHTLGEFLEQFPTVSRERAIQALEEAKESLVAKIS